MSTALTPESSISTILPADVQQKCLGAALGYFVNSAWIVLPAFVGAGLVFAGITDTCGMGMESP